MRTKQDWIEYSTLEWIRKKGFARAIISGHAAAWKKGVIFNSFPPIEIKISGLREGE